MRGSDENKRRLLAFWSSFRMDLRHGVHVSADLGASCFGDIHVSDKDRIVIEKSEEPEECEVCERMKCNCDELVVCNSCKEWTTKGEPCC